MGSSVYPIVCSLYMEDFDTKAFSTAPHPPDWWFRCVDDMTHIKIKKEFVGEFTNHINSLDLNIKFTSEEENADCSLAFLDTLTIRCSDDQIQTRCTIRILRTPTSTVNFRSNHPLQHKLGLVIRTLHHRTDSVLTDPEDQKRNRTCPQIKRSTPQRCGLQAQG